MIILEPLAILAAIMVFVIYTLLPALSFASKIFGEYCLKMIVLPKVIVLYPFIVFFYSIDCSI